MFLGTLFLLLGLAVWVTPADKFTIGASISSYFLIAGGYGALLGAIFVSFQEKKPWAQGLTFKIGLCVVLSLLYAIYSYLAGAPVIKPVAVIGWIFVIVLAGSKIHPLLYFIGVFASVKTHFVAAPIIRHIDGAPVLSIDLFYLITGTMVVFEFFVFNPRFAINLDFRLKPKDLLIIPGLFLLIFLIDVPVGLLFHFLKINFRPLPWPQAIENVFYLVGVVALLEEIFFRGIILQYVESFFQKKNIFGIPLVIGAVLFGLAHLHPPIYILVASLAGYFYGALFLLTRRLSTSVLLHAAVDLFWVSFLYIPK